MISSTRIGTPFALAIVLLTTTAALGRSIPPGTEHQAAGKAHPAVVRVIVPERGATSFGSGTLVAVNCDYGLVLTNWHVVRDATGQIVVAFPDGFRSGATLLRVDRDWDLAALATWRPNAMPVSLATEPPRPGEPLTIAGYGAGWYRAATGRCTQYVAPGRDLPFEMVELSASARDGDSGGPIFNSHGELAGVLFGSAGGRTTGSYCGRVQWFLASATNDFQRLPSRSTMIAARPEPTPKQPNQLPATTGLPAAAILARPRDVADTPVSGRPHETPDGGWTASQPPSDSNAREDRTGAAGEAVAPDDPVETTLYDQIKNILAGIGLLAILLQGARLLTWAERS